MQLIDAVVLWELHKLRREAGMSQDRTTVSQRRGALFWRNEANFPSSLLGRKGHSDRYYFRRTPVDFRPIRRGKSPRCSPKTDRALNLSITLTRVCRLLTIRFPVRTSTAPSFSRYSNEAIASWASRGHSCGYFIRPFLPYTATKFDVAIRIRASRISNSLIFDPCFSNSFRRPISSEISGFFKFSHAIARAVLSL